MTEHIYKSQSTLLQKLFSVMIIEIFLLFMWLYVQLFHNEIYNVISLNFDLVSIIIAVGFPFLFFLILAVGMVIIIPTEYVITDSALKIRRMFFFKRVEQIIPYDQIERVFLYITWSFSGREKRMILIKKFGKPDANFLYPESSTLMFINVRNYMSFLQDISTISGIPCTCEAPDILKANKPLNIEEGELFSGNILLAALLILAFSTILASPAIILPLHFVGDAVSNIFGTYFTIITFSLFSLGVVIIVLLFIPSVLDMYQKYLIASDGLYIIKLADVIYIPRNLIKGFVYADRNKKGRAGGGLLRIGNAVIVVTVNDFERFLEAMKRYGFQTYETENTY